MVEIADAAFVVSIAVSLTVIGTFIVTLLSHKEKNKKHIQK